MPIKEILEKLDELADPDQIEGMARFGINPKNTYGLRMPVIKKIAKDYKNNHDLAIKLWEIDTRETRIMASLVDEADKVSSQQMDEWALEFDYWEICDQCCTNLFRKTKFAYDKIYQWSKAEEEYVKRAGFALIAVLAIHEKKQDDELFVELLELIERESCDDREMVKKAVNWALRQIGKKNSYLNKIAISKAEKIKTIDSKSAQWISKNALKELTSDKVQSKLEINKKLNNKNI